jgi:hypothetical protein
VLLTKVFSQSKESSAFSLTGEALKQTPTVADVKGYVTCEYNDHWWLCLLLAKNETTEMVEVKFLHPQGPAPSFTYPMDFDDILEVPVSQFLPWWIQGALLAELTTCAKKKWMQQLQFLKIILQETA